MNAVHCVIRQSLSEHESITEDLRGELRTAAEIISKLQIVSADAERLTREVTSLTAAVQLKS